MTGSTGAAPGSRPATAMGGGAMGGRGMSPFGGQNTQLVRTGSASDDDMIHMVPVGGATCVAHSCKLNLAQSLIVRRQPLSCSHDIVVKPGLHTLSHFALLNR